MAHSKSFQRVDLNKNEKMCRLFGQFFKRLQRQMVTCCLNSFGVHDAKMFCSMIHLVAPINCETTLWDARTLPSQILVSICDKSECSSLVSKIYTFVNSFLGDIETTAVNRETSDSAQQTSYYQSMLKREHKVELNDSCVDFVTKDLRPVLALYGEGLHGLLKTYALITNKYGLTNCNPKNVLPSRTTVSKNIFSRSSATLEYLKRFLPTIFENGPGGAISTDLWTDDHKKVPFMCLMVHYIDEQDHLCRRLIANKPLDVNSSKTGEYLRGEMLPILSLYGIDPSSPNVVFVADRGKNVIKALENYKRHSCGSHFLCNVVNKSLSDGRPKEVTDVCRNVVSKINHLGKNSLFQPTVKSFCPTRWNSAIAMFSSISVNWEAIQELFTEHECSAIFEFVEKDEVDSLVRFLTPFSEASKKMQTLTMPSLHLICMYYDKLEKHFIEQENDNEITRAVKENGRTYFNLEIISSQMITTYHKLAIFLHPTGKGLTQMSDQDKDDIEFEV